MKPILRNTLIVILVSVTVLTISQCGKRERGKKIKLEIGLAKGKTKIDKRETIKKRESSREIQRKLKKASYS